MKLAELFSKADQQRLELCKKCQRPEYKDYMKMKNELEFIRGEVKFLKERLMDMKEKGKNRQALLVQSIEKNGFLKQHIEQTGKEIDFTRERVKTIWGPQAWQTIWNVAGAPGKQSKVEYYETRKKGVKNECKE